MQLNELKTLCRHTLIILSLLLISACSATDAEVELTDSNDESVENLPEQIEESDDTDVDSDQTENSDDDSESDESDSTDNNGGSNDQSTDDQTNEEQQEGADDADSSEGDSSEGAGSDENSSEEDSTSDENEGEESETSEDENADPFAELNLPEEYFNYANIELPSHYLENSFGMNSRFQVAAIEADNTPADNPTTDAGATLGRVLFYDKKLSANGTIACASCHQQSHGFADPNILSVGFDGGLTRRHSMGIANARFYVTGKFFWDERADTLEDQALMPFQDPVEMGLSLDELEQIVSEQSYYPPLFEAAFGDSDITSDRIAKAIAQFERSIVNAASKYDVARAAVDSPTDDFPAFTAQENLGKDLFFLPQELSNGDRVDCAGCHVSEAFIGRIPDGPFGTTTATNIGLDAVSGDDQGIFETTGNPDDDGKFKAPSLVNIGARPPYMHDGRFASLEQVVEHYSSGVQNHPNLSRPLVGSDGQPARFNFNENEKAALVAFLNTLTDHTLLSAEKYSDPFIENAEELIK